MENQSQTPQAESKPFKGIVVREASKELFKSTGAKYVLHNVEITEDGPLQGMVVAAQRTLLNAEGDEKAGVEVGDEITVWATVVTDERGSKPFFEIQSGSTTTDDADVLTALGFEPQTQNV